MKVLDITIWEDQVRAWGEDRGCEEGREYLCQEDAVKELVGLLFVLGDVGIGMHAEDLRMGDDGQ